MQLLNIYRWKILLEHYQVFFKQTNITPTVVASVSENGYFGWHSISLDFKLHHVKFVTEAKGHEKLVLE